MQSKRDQRHGGLSARIGSLAYRAAQRAMTLDVSRLMCLDAANVQCVPVDERFSFRFLNAAEVRAFARDAQNDLTSAFAERMRQGRDLCYAALDGRMLAGYAWLALESIEAEQNRGRSADSGVAASFGSDTAFVYRAFTREEFRGRHLYAACLVRALQDLSVQGIGKLFVTADWTNRAARAGCRRAGCRELGSIARFGWRRAMFTLTPPGSAAQGIQFGSRVRPHVRTCLVKA